MIYVVSGYFATFHEGHKDYLDSVVGLMDLEKDKLIVVVANPLQFEQKYENFNPPTWKICEPIYKYLESIPTLHSSVIIAIDRDTTIKETLRGIVKTYPDELVCFVKDGGEYNKENLPESEVSGCIFRFLDNPKVKNASEILNIKKR